MRTDTGIRELAVTTLNTTRMRVRVGKFGPPSHVQSGSSRVSRVSWTGPHALYGACISVCPSSRLHVHEWWWHAALLPLPRHHVCNACVYSAALQALAMLSALLSAKATSTWYAGITVVQPLKSLQGGRLDEARNTHAVLPVHATAALKGHAGHTWQARS